MLLQKAIAPLRTPVWLILGFLLFALGCTREWYVTVDEETAGTTFCFSKSIECAGDGVQFESIDITQVDGSGNRSQVMWSIQGKSDRAQDYILKKVVYGHLPQGWVEHSIASPLTPNVFYSVDGTNYFRLRGNKKPEVFEREEFFKKFVSGKPEGETRGGG